MVNNGSAISLSMTGGGRPCLDAPTTAPQRHEMRGPNLDDRFRENFGDETVRLLVAEAVEKHSV